jgi:hypothetical protein
MRDIGGAATRSIPLFGRVRIGTPRIGFREGGYAKIIGIS